MFNGLETTGIESEFAMRGNWLWPKADEAAYPAVFGTLPDLQLAYKHLRKTVIAVQAGGNAGVWPKYMAQTFQRVYTFEPEPRNFYCLAHNCPESGIVKFNCALGQRREMGAIVMTEGEGNLGACRVVPGDQFPIMKLDDFPINGCDLIQFDLEGYDYFALQGAEQTIKAFRPVLMVEDKGLSQHYGVPYRSVVTLLQSWGYRQVEEIHRDLIFASEAIDG